MVILASRTCLDLSNGPPRSSVKPINSTQALHPIVKRNNYNPSPDGPNPKLFFLDFNPRPTPGP